MVEMLFLIGFINNISNRLSYFRFFHNFSQLTTFNQKEKKQKKKQYKVKSSIIVNTKEKLCPFFYLFIYYLPLVSFNIPVESAVSML